MVQLNDLKNLDGDTLLGALGLQRRRSADWVAPAVGALAVGAVMGAAAALLLTPQTGEKLRGQLRKRLADARRPRPEREVGRLREAEHTDA